MAQPSPGHGVSARRKFLGTWVQHPPPTAEIHDAPDFCAGDFGTYEGANFYAKYCALMYGPTPDWWDVVEWRRKDSRSVCAPNTWIPVRRWVAGVEQAIAPRDWEQLDALRYAELGVDPSRFGKPIAREASA